MRNMITTLLVIIALLVAFTAEAGDCTPGEHTYSQGCDCVFIPFPPHHSCSKSQTCTKKTTCGANGASTTSTTCGECK